MKKKQLFAILLAGTIAAGGAPAAAFASAEAVSESADSAGSAEGSESADSAGSAESSEGTAASSGESAAETPAAEPTATEAPAAEPTATEAPAAEPTATEAPAAEPTATEAPAAEPTATTAPTAAPATVTEAPAPAAADAETTVTPTATPTAAATDTGIAIYTTTDGDTTVTYYESLQAAVDAVAASTESTEATVITITRDLALDSSINIDNGKKIAIQAQSGVSITRAAGFIGDMFTVSGEGSELQLGIKDSGSLTVNGAKGADNDTVTGSIVSVKEKATFGILEGVTLTKNDTTADGAAVNNDGGTVDLFGGSIKDNAGAKGAVYSNTEVNAKGKVDVSGNYQYTEGARTETAANLYLDNSSDSEDTVTDVKVAGDMTGSTIGVTLASPSAGAQVLSRGELSEDGTTFTADMFTAAVALFSYDTDDYEIEASDEGNTAVLKKVDFLTYSTTGEAWSDFTTFTTGTFTTTKDCIYYYTTVPANSTDSAIEEAFNTVTAGTEVDANGTFTVTAQNIDSTTPWLVVKAVPEEGKNAEYKIIKLNEGTINKSRPYLSNLSVTWVNHNKMKISLDTERTGTLQYKASWMTSNSSNVDNEPSTYSQNTSVSSSPLTLTVSSVPETDKWLVCWFKSEQGEVQQVLVKLDDTTIKSSRPAEATPTPTTKPSTVTKKSQSWQDHSTLKVNFKNSGAVSYYYEIVDSSSSGTWDASKATKSVSSSTTSFSETVTDIPDDDTKKIIFWFKLNSSGEHKKITINLSDLKSSRPDATVTTRAAKTYSVSESTVTWEDGTAMTTAKKFYPQYFYPFTVTGAGTDNDSPVTGDERWVPQYWTMSTQSGATQHTSWKIGSTSGIKNAASYNMYVYFKKQRYNGKEWVDTGEVEYKMVTFRSAGYTDDEYSEFLQELDPDDENYTGSYTEVAAELTATEAAVEQDSSSSTDDAAGTTTSKTAASTADEAPVGSMTALALLSALAGGYILTRRRKKADN